MPDKPLTVLTYAASASLAAVALVYFFNPNYLIDGESSSSASSRKKGVVGLFNPANDCFINCVLQALAGLGDLRLFLIRETHRRELGSPEIYESTPLKDENGKNVSPEKLASLQTGEVTKGLKDMMDRLNERPIYRKTISASPFIRVLERAFGTRIAKTQQDAQELLQIVAERLSEEYHAGKAARSRARKLLQIPENDPRISAGIDPQANGSAVQNRPISPAEIEDLATGNANEETEKDLQKLEEGYPLEGQTETRIECQFCHFIPKVTPTSFVMLTLAVPQKSSSSLNECFDGHFKTEFIDDYVCDRCRLVHAAESYERMLSQASREDERAMIRSNISKLREAIENDPEKAPDGVKLPDSKNAPKRKIGRYVQITRFPKILIIHLSRSIFVPQTISTKNLSKVSFPENLPVGGLLNRRNYKLLGVVCHKGTHHSGHYETFRRQHLYAPYSNPHLDRSVGPYAHAATPTHSASSTPVIVAETAPPLLERDSVDGTKVPPQESSTSIQSSSPSRKSDPRYSTSTRPSSGSTDATTVAKTADPLSPTKSAVTSNGAPRTSFSTYRSNKSRSSDNPSRKRRRKHADRWWRISDDKIKECKTNEVLGMQREVYMLFYEVEKEGGN